MHPGSKGSKCPWFAVPQNEASAALMSFGRLLTPTRRYLVPAVICLGGAVTVGAPMVLAAVTAPVTRIGGAPFDAPLAPLAAPAAAPQIVDIWLNSTVLSAGDTLSAQVTTTTNVASLEARVAIFSLVARRPTFGQFTLVAKVPRVPFWLHGKYALELIARNAAGQEDLERIPIVIR